MKFSLKVSVSSDVGYAESASSPASSIASISEISETDPFLLGNVVEVKAVDELPEEISELLCRGDVSGLMQSGKDKKVLVKTSSPCLLDAAVQPKYRGGRKKEVAPHNMTSEQRFQWEKLRQKKDNHNDIERRRRDKINECIRVLSLIVPNGDDTVEYNKKGAVLEAAVNYIRRLQSDQRQMEEYRKQQELLQQTNRSLMLEIQQLQSNAQQVCISPPHLGPPVRVQQVMLHQRQPHFEPRSSLGQGTLPDTHHVELLMTPNHQHIPQPQIEMQQQQQQQQMNPFLNKFLNFEPESSSEFHLVTDGGHFDDAQFKTVSEIVFLDEPPNDLRDLADHGSIDIVPDHADAIGYSMDDLFGVQSVQLNGDPLLSNATDVPMIADFDDPYIPLALL